MHLQLMRYCAQQQEYTRLQTMYVADNIVVNTRMEKPLQLPQAS